MTAEHPRSSTSDALLDVALDYARLVAGQVPDHPLAGGGRNAHKLDSEPTG